eukprot:1031669-Pleurochrysis_carterae.AAC.1
MTEILRINRHDGIICSTLKYGSLSINLVGWTAENISAERAAPVLLPVLSTICLLATGMKNPFVYSQTRARFEGLPQTYLGTSYTPMLLGGVPR